MVGRRKTIDRKPLRGSSARWPSGIKPDSSNRERTPAAGVIIISEGA
jgi:hypothetical protein